VTLEILPARISIRRIDLRFYLSKGAGHEIQFAGQPVNEALPALWPKRPFIKP
jgi:hypothetical protein